MTPAFWAIIAGLFVGGTIGNYLLMQKEKQDDYEKVMEIIQHSSGDGHE